MKSARSTSRKSLVVTAVLALAALGSGGAYVASGNGPSSVGPFRADGSVSLRGEDPATPPKPDESVLVKAPANPELTRVTVMMDGWSLETLEKTKVTYTPDPHPNGVGNEAKTKPVAFAPLSPADLGALAKDTPDVLTRVAARMVTVDPTLKCTPESCTASGEKLPFTYFTDPASVPGYGPSYAAYNIPAAVQKADLLVPKDTKSIQVQAEGYEPYLLTVTDLAPSEEPDEQPEPSARNGYGEQRYLLSAAFGRFFVPTPAWLEGTNADGTPLLYAVDEVVGLSPDVPLVAQYQETPLFAKGLAAPVTEALHLGDSKLTHMTSPTVGCEPGVTCVPGTVEVSVDRVEESKTFRGCTEDAQGESRLVSTASYWTLTYPHPTHQYGVWDGKTVETLEGRRAGDQGFFGGATPPLVSGKQTLRHSNLLFFVGVEEPRLWDVIGYTAQEGKDAPETFEVDHTPDDLPDLAGGYFKAC